MDLHAIQEKYQRLMGPLPAAALQRAHQRAGAIQEATSERGLRTTPENQIRYLYRQMWTDPALRATILELRRMDLLDPRVKKIHNKTASAIIKGGLRLKNSDQAPSIKRAWEKFQRRMSLTRRPKLHSDARGLMMEGNLPMQWVLDETRRMVLQGVRMPSETILPKVGKNGLFLDPRSAYEQHDLTSGAVLYTFPLWQLTLGRLTPDNWDAPTWTRPGRSGAS